MRHSAHSTKFRRGVLAPLLLALCGTGVASAATPVPDESQAETRAFILANLQYATVHEVGHVVLATRDVPVLGYEEEGADQLAILTLLQPGGPDSLQTLLGAADGWLLEWYLRMASNEDPEYWDSHPLDIQRYYNIVCLAYGSLRGLVAWPRRLDLPYMRAWRCEDEYRMAERALERLMQAPTPSRTPGKVRVVYEPPATPEREELLALVRGSGVLERIARHVETRFALPYDVTIVLANICGATAYWRSDLREIIVCYRLVERFRYLAQFRYCLGRGRVPILPSQPTDGTEIRRCIARASARSHWLEPR